MLIAQTYLRGGIPLKAVSAAMTSVETAMDVAKMVEYPPVVESKNKMKYSQIGVKAEKMSVLGMMIVSRALEIAGEGMFAEVATRVALMNIKDFQFSPSDEFSEVSCHFLEFLKNKYHQFSMTEDDIFEVICGEKIPKTEIAEKFRKRRDELAIAYMSENPEKKEIFPEKKIRIKGYSYSEEREEPIKRSYVLNSLRLTSLKKSNSKNVFEIKNRINTSTRSLHHIPNSYKTEGGGSNLSKNKNDITAVTASRLKDEDDLEGILKSLKARSEDDDLVASLLTSKPHPTNEIKTESKSHKKSASNPMISKFQHQIAQSTQLLPNTSNGTPQSSQPLLTQPASRRCSVTSYFLHRPKSSRPLSLGVDYKEEKSPYEEIMRRPKPPKHVCLGRALPQLLTGENLNGVEMSDDNFETVEPVPLKSYIKTNDFAGLVDESVIYNYYNKKSKNTSSIIEPPHRRDICKRFINLHNSINQEKKNYKFVRKCLKNRHLGTDHLKAADKLPENSLDFFAIQAANAKVARDEAAKSASHNETTNVALQLLVGRLKPHKNTIPAAKRMQAILFDHRQALGVQKVYSFWKGLDKDDQAKEVVVDRNKTIERKCTEIPKEIMEAGVKQNLKDAMNDTKARIHFLDKLNDDIHFVPKVKPQDQPLVKLMNSCNSLAASVVKDCPSNSSNIKSIFDLVKRHKLAQLNRGDVEEDYNEDEESK